MVEDKMVKNEEQKPEKMIRFICLDCNTKFKKANLDESPICPNCGQINNVFEMSKKYLGGVVIK
jgi:hypothetical protein